MNRSHQTRTYPAHKRIPPSVLKGYTPYQRKLAKKVHTRRSRRYKESAERDEPLFEIEKGLKMRKYQRRNAAMITMRQSGKTLREIGEKFGVSYERVRQITKSVGLPEFSAICVVCDSPFVTTELRIRTCSDSCQRVRRIRAK